MLRDRNRRRLTLATILAPVLTPGAADSTRLRFGTTPVFLDDQMAMLDVWQKHLEQALNVPVQFIQRGSYREIVDLLLDDAIDVAWVCGPPYVSNDKQLALVAVPVYQGAPLYRSHLIVPDRDRATSHIADLRGRVFAYSDPLSNSGHLVPRVELVRMHQRPEEFFRRTFFTYAHRKVVEAVQVGLAQGGAVDGYVWDTLALQQPHVTRGVRVAWRSSLYGFPPIVGRKSLGVAGLGRVTNALVRMGETQPGQQLLRRLNIDGFVPGNAMLFDSIRDLVNIAERARA